MFVYILMVLKMATINNLLTLVKNTIVCKVVTDKITTNKWNT